MGEAVVLEVGPYPGGRNDRGDSLSGHSQWEAPQVPFPGVGESVFALGPVDDVREARCEVGFGDGG